MTESSAKRKAHFMRAADADGEQHTLPTQGDLLQRVLRHVDAKMFETRELLLQQAAKHHETVLANQNLMMTELAAIKAKVNALTGGQVPLHISGTVSFSATQPEPNARAARQPANQVSPSIISDLLRA